MFPSLPPEPFLNRQSLSAFQGKVVPGQFAFGLHGGHSLWTCLLGWTCRGQNAGKVQLSPHWDLSYYFWISPPFPPYISIELKKADCSFIYISSFRKNPFPKAEWSRATASDLLVSMCWEHTGQGAASRLAGWRPPCGHPGEGGQQAGSLHPLVLIVKSELLKHFCEEFILSQLCCWFSF